MLQELREERKQALVHVEKLDHAISAMESLNGTGSSLKAKQPVRTLSAAARKRISLAQKVRWAKARKESQPGAGAAKTTVSAPAKRKHTMSVEARKKIAAFQRARWAKIKAGQKKKAA
jgi:hypothetical protein